VVSFARLYYVPDGPVTSGTWRFHVVAFPAATIIEGANHKDAHSLVVRDSIAERSPVAPVSSLVSKLAVALRPLGVTLPDVPFVTKTPALHVMYFNSGDVTERK
jgi:hypothetical protein